MLGVATGQVEALNTPIALVLIGALATFVFAYVPSKFRQSRVRDDEQLALLTTLKNAILPDGRMGPIERIEILERNLSNCVNELEAMTRLNESQRTEVLSTIDRMQRELREARTSVVDRT